MGTASLWEKAIYRTNYYYSFMQRRFVTIPLKENSNRFVINIQKEKVDIRPPVVFR